MRTVFITLIVLGFGCGEVHNQTIDAANPPSIDAAIDAAPPPVDATPPLALDCNTYCTAIDAACTGTLDQFGTNCMATCATYPLGTQADTSGNTLGCRNYHIQNITVRGNPVATHCPHTGPVGSAIAAATGTCGDSACANFCAMEATVCGTDANKVLIGGVEVTNRYADAAACMTACAGFATTPEYSPTAPNGNTFTCRFYHLTNAAAQAAQAGRQLHCGHTLTPALSVCI